MTNEQIDKFFDKADMEKNLIRISFKSRKPIVGLFIKGKDYQELRAKNFWRILWENQLSVYEKSNDINLARIFNGGDMTRLTVAASFDSISNE